MGISKHPPELLRHELWPTVDIELLEEGQLQRFHTYKAAVEAICHGEKNSHVARRYAISRSNLTYILSRCVESHPDGRPWGYRALIPGARHVPYTRRKIASVTADSDGYGLAGAFEQMLAQHPSVVGVIEKAIKGIGPQKVREGGLNIASLHQDVLKQLRKNGVGNNDYPFNSKNAGYFSLLRYMKKKMDEGRNEVARYRFGQSALDGLQAGTGKKGHLRSIHALDIACYDEQELPFFGTLTIDVGEKEIDVPLSRGYLCLLVDTDSLCILGYTVTVDPRIRSLQLLTAYESFLTPWVPKQLSVPGMKYQEGAGLPSGVVPVCRGQLICVISIDNHLSHLAESVVGHLRARTGAILRFGKVRHWIARQTVEGVFAELQKHSFTRIPSTTGSGPDDPAVNKPTKKAVDLRIRIDQLLEMIDVIVANYNTTPKRSLMSKTPLQSLTTSLDENSRLSILPRVPETFLADPQIAVEIITSTVAGSREKGRRPYIEIDGGKYTNDILSQSWSMIGKKLTVHIRGDFRTVRVFRDDGSEFGTLMVMGHWADSFHTRETRKEINRLHREKIINKWNGDPVKSFQAHLAHESLKKSAKNPYKISRESSKLATSLHEENPQKIRYNVEPLSSETSETRKPKSRGRRQFFGGKGGSL
ncbi:MAG: hypothetical protein ACK4F4_11085 [Hylemonella sp.]|uniref:hypothetical protein n=1 Tax=Hylemonella sp. TaxID=2066020 RepID=UPI00391ADA19